MKKLFITNLRLFLRDKQTSEILLVVFMTFFLWMMIITKSWFGIKMTPPLFFFFIILMGSEFIANTCANFKGETCFLLIHPIDNRIYLLIKEIFWIILVISTLIICYFVLNIWYHLELIPTHLKYILCLPWIASSGIFCSMIFIRNKSSLLKFILFMIAFSISFGLIVLFNHWILLLIYTIFGIVYNYFALNLAPILFSIYEGDVHHAQD